MRATNSLALVDDGNAGFVVEERILMRQKWLTSSD